MQAAASMRRLHAGRLIVLALVAGFLALLAYGLLSKGRDDRIDSALSAGRHARAPGFTLEVLERGTLHPRLARKVGPTLADGELSLSELRGVPVVLNLWASWCTPCRAEAPRLERAWRSFASGDVLVLGLNIQDLRDDARGFDRRYGITYPSVREPAREVANRYGATGIPETFFIDGAGRVVGHVIGAASTRQLELGASAARDGRVVGTSSGGDFRKSESE